MKKNKAMRLASVLLILVLMTSSVVGGTFAKYVTKVEGTDTARVARWGFTGEDADLKISDLFLKAYDNVTGSNSDVIAPGTSNSTTFIFEYSQGTTDIVAAPEVAYTFEVDTSGSSCATAIQNNENIKWAVLKTSELVNGEVPEAEWDTWTKMIYEIKDLDGNKQYNPGDSLPPITEEHTIAWKWDFSTSDDHDKTVDTVMGNAGDLADVTIDITVTATQID